MRRLESIADSIDLSLSKLIGDSGEQKNLACYSPWDYRVRYNLVTEQQI